MLDELLAAMRPAMDQTSSIRLVDGQIVLDHAVGPEASSRAARTSRRSSSTASSTAAIASAHVIDEVAGDALVDDLGHRAAAVGHDRCSAHHRLDHREPERLGEGDRVQQRRGRRRGRSARSSGPTEPR